MKAIPTPTKKQVQRVAQDVHDITMRCVADNTAMLLIAVARRYGFREKRINDIIVEFNQVSREYHQYDEDGVFYDKINEEPRAIGVDMKKLIDIRDVMQEIHKKKKKEENRMSIKEEYEMRRQVEKMRGLL